MLSVALVVFFTFCQVFGVMCTMPDLSEADAPASLVNERMTYLMDGTVMCPPSMTSPPERQVKQVKNGAVVAPDHGPNVLGLAEGQRTSSVPPHWSRSSVHSTVPLSMSSFSVLRI
jgi:hypothetical protein